MPIFLLNFFRGLNLKTVLYALAAAAVAFAVWQGVGFVNDKFEADRKVDVLERQVDDYVETVRVLEESAAQKERAQSTADAVRTDQQRLRFNYGAIRRDAASAKEEDDGEAAPVLRRTLDALDRM